jgi:DNA repair protein RadC
VRPCTPLGDPPESRSNHPSGDPAPSSADMRITRQLREASRILDIQMLDHVVCGDAKADPQRRGFYSFREAGLL